MAALRSPLLRLGSFPGWRVAPTLPSRPVLSPNAWRQASFSAHRPSYGTSLPCDVPRHGGSCMALARGALVPRPHALRGSAAPSTRHSRRCHSLPDLAAPTAEARKMSESAASRLSQMMRSKRKIPFLGSLSISEIFGHASFMLSGTAFLEPDILGLRMLSVISGAATLIFTYWHPIGKPLWIPFGWNVLFILINGARIYEILYERRKASQLPEQAVELWRSVFAAHGIDKTAFAKLFQAGTWVTFRKGATLSEEGQPSNSVILVVRGGADVFFEGQFARSLSERQFIGEMGLGSGLAISSPMKGVSTVVTNQQTTCLVWRRHKLYELLKAHPDIKSALQAAISADILRKLQNRATYTDPSVAHRMWLARYSSVLSALLAQGDLTDTHRAQLEAFRESHHVSHLEHLEALRACGWSEAEFATGKRAQAQAASTSLSESAAKRRRFRRQLTDGQAPTAEDPLKLWDARKHMVVAVQERLNAFFGTNALEVDGEFGPLTQQSVELFQIIRGLRGCGKVGPETWGALRQAHLHRLEEQNLLSVLRGFDKQVDVEVALLQHRLRLMYGEDVVALDGHYGPRTQAAVEAFLREHNLPMNEPNKQELSAQAAAILRDSYLDELEHKVLQKANSTADTNAKAPKRADQYVAVLQLSLNQLYGREVVKPDGVYGKRTQKAVEDFQQLFGMPLNGDVFEQLQTVSRVLRGTGFVDGMPNPVDATAEKNGAT
ncbi:hypothetical protein AB1Y20_022244 [Prymnesium parvum]|uniref:Cyclic nucleotide-binding domain-containing protein n=1 Tax=Prymnesium parvum TaxID=97485 RepID=A0AB34JID9_PRYPA